MSSNREEPLGPSMPGRAGRIHVAALPFGCTEGRLRELFEPFGPIESIALVADWENPTEEPHAAIALARAEEAVARMDGRKVGNTYLRVHRRDARE